MSISGKVRFGLAVLLAFLAAQFLVSFFLDRATSKEVDTAITKNFAAADELAELGIIGQSIRRYEKEFFIYAEDGPGRAKYRKEWTDAYDKLNAKLDTLQANKEKRYSAEDVAAFATWKSAADFYGSEFKGIMKKADDGAINPPPPKVEPVATPPGKTAAVTPAATPAPAPAPVAQTAFVANGLIGPGKDRFRTLLDGSTKMRQAKAAESAKSVTAIKSGFSTATMVQIGVFLLGLLLALYLMFSIPKAVRAPIESFVEVVEKMSKGDLKQTIDLPDAAEFGGLATSLDRLRIAQSGLVEKLRAKATSPFK